MEPGGPPLIVTAREALTGMPLTMLGPFAVVTLIAAVLVFIGLVGFRVAMPHLIARMGG